MKKNKIIVITAIVLTILTIGIFIYWHFCIKNDKKIQPNIQNYIVTEKIKVNNDNVTKNYEVHYFTGEKKSYLVLIDEDDLKQDKPISEVKTTYTTKVTDFDFEDTANTIQDLSPYVDESGFVYRCNVNIAKDFLSYQVSSGKLITSHETPIYFETYIKSKDDTLLRGLYIYNTDKKTGDLIFKKCSDSVSPPTITDIVTVIEHKKPSHK